MDIVMLFHSSHAFVGDTRDKKFFRQFVFGSSLSMVKLESKYFSNRFWYCCETEFATLAGFAIDIVCTITQPILKMNVDAQELVVCHYGV